jgi:hypothetical protein
VQAWVARPECQIKLRFIPVCCPHLDPIERPSGLMRRNIVHNKCNEKFADFKPAILTFPREDVTRNRGVHCGDVSDNFRIISPEDFRIQA